jgi:hypothetical protein
VPCTIATVVYGPILVLVIQAGMKKSVADLDLLAMNGVAINSNNVRI